MEKEQPQSALEKALGNLVASQEAAKAAAKEVAAEKERNERGHGTFETATLVLIVILLLLVMHKLGMLGGGGL